MKARIVFSDIAWGIAILVIIMAHTINYHNSWLDSWTMPVFFVIMGVFFRPTETWREMIIKKSYTILLPFLLLSIPSFIQYAIQLPLVEIIKRILDPFNCMHGVGWFLVCMYWCYLLYYGIHRIAKGKIRIKLVLSLLLSVVFFYLSTINPSFLLGHRIVLPLFVSTSLTCLPLICIGEILRPIIMRDYSENRIILAGSVIMGETVRKL